MTAADWIVLLLGLGTIAWINWYFFLAQRGRGTSEPDVREEGVEEQWTS